MKMTPEKIARAKEMRDEGMTYQSIGSALGIGYSTVRYHIHDAYRANHEAKGAAYRETHKEEAAAYRDSTKDDWRQYHAAYRAEHKKEHAAHQATYRVGHKEEVTAYNREWRKKNPEIMAANRVAYRALMMGAMIGATVAQKEEIKAIYKKAKEDPKIRCYLCGEWIPIGERHVDHVRALANGGAHRPSNLAVSCADCNLKKGAKTLEEVGLLL